MPRSRVAASPKTSTETRTPSLCSFRGGVPHELRDVLRHRHVASHGVADRGDVAVGGEADVVELDLVEAGPRNGRRDRDVVVPDPAVVGIQPAEPAACVPDRAVGVLQRELRPALGDDGILEGDDPPDQVEAGRVHLPSGAPRVEVGLRRSRRTRERRRALDEADLAVLVLHVELDRVQAGAPQRHVLRELAADAGERHRHVNAAHLAGRRARAVRRLGLRLGNVRRGTHLLGAASRQRMRAEGEAAGHGDEDREGGQTSDQDGDVVKRGACVDAGRSAPLVSKPTNAETLVVWPATLPGSRVASTKPEAAIVRRQGFQALSRASVDSGAA